MMTFMFPPSLLPLPRSQLGQLAAACPGHPGTGSGRTHRPGGRLG